MNSIQQPQNEYNTLNNLLENSEKFLVPKLSVIKISVDEEKNLLETILLKVVENLSDIHFSSTKLAEMIGMKRRTMDNFLRRTIDKTSTEIIKVMRLIEALKKIRAGEKSFGMIATETGFSSQSHFTRTFTAFFEQTPSSYKKSVSIAANSFNQESSVESKVDMHLAQLSL